jgi:hypothetical protein
LEADEVLFSAFCPRKLKQTLEEAPELELHPLPCFKGLDGGAALKLGAAIVMIGVMAGTTVAPQVQVFQDAADALCGMHRDTPRRSRACLGTRGTTSVLRMRRR